MANDLVEKAAVIAGISDCEAFGSRGWWDSSGQANLSGKTWGEILWILARQKSSLENSIIVEQGAELHPRN